MSTQDYYQSNEAFKAYVDHWAWKHNVSIDEVLAYSITALVAEQYQSKEEEHKYEEKYELHQDNGIN